MHWSKLYVQCSRITAVTLFSVFSVVQRVQRCSSYTCRTIMASNDLNDDPRFSELIASTVDRLLSRLDEISNALSTPVKTVRRIFREGNNQNIQQRSGANVQSSISSFTTLMTKTSARALPPTSSDSPGHFVARRKFEGQRSFFPRQKH